MKKTDYDISIPSNVRHNYFLVMGAKMMYGEIAALSDIADECGETNEYCWESNDYFAKLYSTSIQTIKGWIEALEHYGYITIIYKDEGKSGESRHLKINN